MEHESLIEQIIQGIDYKDFAERAFELGAALFIEYAESYKDRDTLTLHNEIGRETIYSVNQLSRLIVNLFGAVVALRGEPDDYQMLGNAKTILADSSDAPKDKINLYRSAIASLSHAKKQRERSVPQDFDALAIAQKGLADELTKDESTKEEAIRLYGHAAANLRDAKRLTDEGAYTVKRSQVELSFEFGYDLGEELHEFAHKYEEIINSTDSDILIFEPQYGNRLEASRASLFQVVLEIFDLAVALRGIPKDYSCRADCKIAFARISLSNKDKIKLTETAIDDIVIALDEGGIEEDIFYMLGMAQLDLADFYIEENFKEKAISNYTDAIKSFDRSIIMHGNNPTFYYWRGIAKESLAKLKESDEKIALLREATDDFEENSKIEPSGENYYHEGMTKSRLAFCLYEKGTPESMEESKSTYESSIVVLDKAVKERGECFDYHWRGVARFQLNNLLLEEKLGGDELITIYTQCADDLSHAISLEGPAISNSLNYHWLGRIQVAIACLLKDEQQMTLFEKAIACLNTAVKRSGGSSEDYYERAVARYEWALVTHNIDKKRELLQAALSDAEASYNKDNDNDTLQLIDDIKEDLKL